MFLVLFLSVFLDFAWKNGIFAPRGISKGIILGIIRIFLALSVVVWHLWGHALPFTANGYNAVILFFIISGFYMSMVLNSKYLNAPVTNFYFARALRIYPIYLVILALTVWFLDATGKPLPLPATTGGWLFATSSNITIFGIPWLGDANWLAIPPAWTLAIELQFYLAAPFILTRRLWVCVAVLLGLVALRLSLLDQEFTSWRYTVPRADWCFFMLGAVSHRVGLFVMDDHTRKRLGWMSVAILPTAAFLCGIPVVKDLDRPELWLFYLLFAASIPFIFAISARSRIDRLLGDLSYPVYVSHWLVIGFVGHFTDFFYRYVPYDYHREGNIVLVSLAAACLHFGFERPIENFRQRLSSASGHARSAPSLARHRAPARAAAPAE
ncbi:MAG: acyltransferase [Hyphomicrobiales bacterium]|nr:acyltransferase [Hyphomicrobiales bacterium]